MRRPSFGVSPRRFVRGRAATTVLSRDELSRRLGDRAVGAFMVSVARPAAELFEIRIRPQGSQQDGLATLVYRPELPVAPRQCDLSPPARRNGR